MLNKKTTPRKPLATLAIVCLCGMLMSSSHREAALIANDPLDLGFGCGSNKKAPSFPRSFFTASIAVLYFAC